MSLKKHIAQLTQPFVLLVRNPAAKDPEPCAKAKGAEDLRRIEAQQKFTSKNNNKQMVYTPEIGLN